jgi:hypothetical protein
LMNTLESAERGLARHQEQAGPGAGMIPQPGLV